MDIDNRLCTILQEQILRFIDRISDMIGDINSDYVDLINDLIIVRAYFALLVPSKIMDDVCCHILPHAEEISSRNKIFFIENKSIFKGLPENKVSFISDLIESGSLSMEDIDEIWKFFDVFIALSKRYEDLQKNKLL